MKSLRVLVVDDDRDFAEALTDVLESEGHDVDSCYTGEDAIERFRQNEYDVSFIDVKLPKKNGVESFLEIKKLRPEAKVVMMTGFSVEQLLQQAVDNGAFAIMHKPLEMTKVLALIEGVLPAGVVLIADDDPDFSRSLKEHLEDRGFSVQLAKNGSEALTRIEEESIDLLILDLRMPVLDGLGVYMELKRRDRLLPTIIVTGYAIEESETLDSFRSMSVTGILVKPFDPAELLHSVSELIGRCDS
tara:strand:- start:899 stop:1633 length:735 start_codon:yes stop_codon:yes gene_type:complete